MTRLLSTVLVACVWLSIPKCIAAADEPRLRDGRNQIVVSPQGPRDGGDFGTTWQLTRLVGQAKAKELFFLGDIVGAQEAHRIGLANRVLPADGFKSEAHAIAKKIAHGPLVSYRYLKENVNLSLESDFRTILDREAMTHLRCGMTEDHKEGVRAFMEKRPPEWRCR